MSLDQVRGWFADAEEKDGRTLWRPRVQTDFAGITDLDIQFDDRETCEWFIRKHLVGQGWLDGPRRHACPTCGAPAEDWCVFLGTDRKRIAYHPERRAFMFGGWTA